MKETTGERKGKTNEGEDGIEGKGMQMKERKGERDGKANLGKDGRE